MNDIEEEVLSRIRPTDDENERIERLVNSLISKLEAEAKKMNLNVKFILVGSAAKGTHLKNADIDIFVQYTPNTPKEELEKSAIALGRRVIDGEVRYAEHPYLHGFVSGYDVDIVPCYEIKDASERITAVDRTPLHTEFIKRTMKNEQKDEVRLLKRFMKGIGAYGAELSVQGFSGYLVELLILKYGSFRNVLTESINWKKKTRLNLSETQDAKLKYDSPFVFIDPTDPRRNVASALSMEKLSLFKYAAKCYLKNPNIKFFFPPDERVADMEKIRMTVNNRGTYLVGVRMKKPDVVEDIYYPQIRKCILTIKKYLQRNRYRIIREEFIVNEYITIIFELEHGNMPPAIKRMGPPVGSQDEENFIKKWMEGNAFSEPFIEGERWYVIVPRHHITAEDSVKEAVTTLNIGKHLREELKRGFDVLSHEILLSKKYHYEKILTRLLFPTFPWNR